MLFCFGLIEFVILDGLVKGFGAGRPKTGRQKDNDHETEKAEIHSNPPSTPHPPPGPVVGPGR